MRPKPEVLPPTAQRIAESPPQSARNLLGLPPPLKRLPLPVLHQSAVHAHETCPTYGGFANNLGLRKKSRMTAADESSYMHIGLKYLLDPAVSSPKQRRLNAKQAMKIAYDRIAGEVKAARRGYDNPELSELTEGRLTQTMNFGYALALRLSGVIRRAVKKGAFKIAATEVSVSTTFGFGDTAVSFAGIVDVIFQDHNGDLWPWDHKSTSAVPRRFVRSLDYAVQAFSYTHALRAMLMQGGALGFTKRGLKVPGFMYGVIEKPSIRRKGLHTANPQTLKDFIGETDEWFDGIGRHKDKRKDREANPPVLLHRQLVAQAWPAAIVARLLAAHKSCGNDFDPANTPRHDGQCLYGRSECTYYDLCTSPFHLWRDVMKRLFTITRDPLRS